MMLLCDLSFQVAHQQQPKERDFRTSGTDTVPGIMEQGAKKI